MMVGLLYLMPGSQPGSIERDRQRRQRAHGRGGHLRGRRGCVRPAFGGCRGAGWPSWPARSMPRIRSGHPVGEPLVPAVVRRLKEHRLPDPQRPRLSAAPTTASRPMCDATALRAAGDLWRAPQKSHKYASRAAPTGIPRTRRHSAAHPGTPVKIEPKTSPKQAKRRYRRLLAVVVRDRIELSTFRFSGGRSYRLSYLTWLDTQ